MAMEWNIQGCIQFIKLQWIWLETSEGKMNNFIDCTGSERQLSLS